MKLRPATARVPAPVLFVGSGIFQYSGAALAVSLFALLGPGPTTWWRLLVGAVVLTIMWRPWRQAWTRSDLLASALFGVFLALMNLQFYEAIARIPLGVAVSVEFAGPVAVAVIRGRGWAPRIAAGLALAGIAIIGGWELNLHDRSVLIGAVFAVGAAAMWAGYIVLGQRIAARRSGVKSLTVGCWVGALLLAPFFAKGALPAVISPLLVASIVGMGVLSTAIPYSFEALALGRLKPETFAVLSALLPATSTIVGAVMLRQFPGVSALGGLLFISLAVWLATKAEVASAK